MMPVETVRWNNRGLDILDQRLLPLEEKRIILTTTDEVCAAIKSLAVRGAPAIGVAAAYGVVVAAREKTDRTHVLNALTKLRGTRPTAVNLFNALNRMEAAFNEAFGSADPVAVLLRVARDIHEEDDRICRKLAWYGAQLLDDGDTVLTHCNAGGLATSGYGTALGVIYAAVEAGKRIRVYADETRPLFQGARLTAWELFRSGIDVTVICDSMAAVVLREGKIDHVIVGADRIAANGDAANKIGTYGLSITARAHGVPLYIAAPLTSFDFGIASGDEIPIEQRDAAEIHTFAGTAIAPPEYFMPRRPAATMRQHGEHEGTKKKFGNVSFYNPAFDITPAENITAIISEKGIARQPLAPALAEWAK